MATPAVSTLRVWFFHFIHPYELCGNCAEHSGAEFKVFNMGIFSEVLFIVAGNSYFISKYKIGGENLEKKKLRYAILKEVDKGNKILKESDFSVSEENFDDATRFLTREDYLAGIFYADDRPQYFEGAAYLTAKGENYLEENSNWGKAYRGLKEIREWIK